MRITHGIIAAAIAASLGLTTWGCSADVGPAAKYSRKQAQKSLSELEEPGLLIGTFKLANNAVLDGDTLKVKGLETTLRLLAIDTEEIYHSKKRARDADNDFLGYLRRERLASKKPPKIGTPNGMAAHKWAEKFFEDVDAVRLERDHPKEIRGRFNRYLTYVFVQRDGKWVNYNVEIVRAGYSPYFMKYGYSRRFHDEFIAAQNEARAAKRGIWSDDCGCYGDYDTRLKWWNERAAYIKAFEEVSETRDDHIALTRWDALQVLNSYKGKEVTILAAISKIKLGDSGPTKVFLSRRRGGDMPLVFFDKDLFGSLNLTDQRGEFITVRGTVAEWKNPYRDRREFQIVITRPDQIELAPRTAITEYRNDAPKYHQ